MSHHRDPEAVSHGREHAEWGKFEVVVIHDEHGELGTLDRTFENDFDAGYAAHEAQLEDVGITTDVRRIDDKPDETEDRDTRP